MNVIKQLRYVALFFCISFPLIAQASSRTVAPLSPTTASAVYLPLIFAPRLNWAEVSVGSASGGGISDNNGESWRTSLAIAPNGTPYVAWDNNGSGTWQIYVRRWNGRTWEEVGRGSASGGGISNNSGLSAEPSLAISPSGNPYVAWLDKTSGRSEIYVRRWNGSIWEEVGTGSASGSGISNSYVSGSASLAIAPNGTPYVAWDSRSFEGWEIFVRRWNGKTWVEVGAGSASSGGISKNSSHSATPSMAIAPDGTPFVSWYDIIVGVGTGERQRIFIRRWNGTTWEEVGAGSATGGGISGYSSGAWHPSLAISPDNKPYVAWTDASGTDPEIYVLRWNNRYWEGVGVGSASNGGISNNTGQSSNSSLAIAPDSTPYVAWGDVSTGIFQIYVRRWNGVTWEEVGADSASGGGIGDTNGDSSIPSIAVDRNGIPYVAWLDSSSGSREVYVRRWMPGTP